MKLLNKFKNERYHLHFAAGAATMVALFIVALISRWIDSLLPYDVGIYFDSLRFWELGLLGFVISGIVGLNWEAYHYFNKGAKFDKWDVIWTGVGGLIISLLYSLFLPAIIT